MGGGSEKRNQDDVDLHAMRCREGRALARVLQLSSSLRLDRRPYTPICVIPEKTSAHDKRQEQRVASLVGPRNYTHGTLTTVSIPVLNRRERPFLMK